MTRIIVGKTSEFLPGKLANFPAKINDLKSYNMVVESDELYVEV